MKQTSSTRAAWIAVPAALLCLAATTTAFTPASAAAFAAAPAASTATDPSLDWTTCEGAGLDPRQQCASVQVPMDYAAPGGRKIDVVISRIPSEKPAARRGALLLIPGGPGGSSLDDPSRKGQKLPQDVRNAYDLIGFAPRGLAPSTSVSCGLDHGDLATSKLWPWPAPDGSVTGNMVTARRVAAACTRNGGELIRHISTVDEARDIAWGVSYGTYAGAVYSQLFPQRTDRIVLDSNDNPDPTRVSRAWLAAYGTGVEDVFPEFAKWASAPGNPDRLAKTAAEVRPLFLRLAAQLDRAPIPWPGANPEELNGNVLRQTMLDSLYTPTRFPTLAKLMRAALHGTVPPAPQAPPEPVLQSVTAVLTATVCNDVAWPTSAAQYRAGVAQSRAEHPLTAGMPRNALVCAAWPYPPRQAPVRITGHGPSDILLVQNERDVATPLSGAQKLRAAFGARAVMVTVDSTGHGAYLANGNACGDRVVSHFLATGERPHEDTRCGR
jgi:pimeloyl-ACP methyl ester carboxylesterase